MIIIIISFIDNLALFYLSLDGTLFPDAGREGSKKKKQILLLSYQQFHLSVLIRILRPSQGPSGAMT